MMKLDKELYRKAYELHQQSSDAKLVERAHLHRELSPAEAFKQYVDLVEFVWRLCPEPSEWQRKEKLESLNRYYAAIQRLEAWRRKHGQAA
ncbi:hypothetical protein L0337_03915 [candidate division KSB1 bacterium]|nr:hypothetical protein [candidate division KSB1 bacterium]